MKDVKQNSTRAWLLATRPKTLAAGSVPVLTASALAYSMGGFQLIPAVLCLLFALLAQIASNFSNDYFDFVKKTDNEERLGPARAVASGWITPRYMLYGTIVVIALACFFGLGLIYYGGWLMVVLGAVCVLSLLAYTAGPFPLAYNGLGDVFVLVFFGWVAVVFSFYLQAGYFDSYAFVAGTAVGLGAINILVLNNYRDRENDKNSNKRTTIVLFGETFGRYFYLVNGFLASLLCLCFIQLSIWAALLPLLYLPFHISTWKTMCSINKGKELNKVLGLTARNLVILGVLLSVGLIV
jgi:1,4-dihydroxy-2-naphthoate octaprenyltransferase